MAEIMPLFARQQKGFLAWDDEVAAVNQTGRTSSKKTGRKQALAKKRRKA